MTEDEKAECAIELQAAIDFIAADDFEQARSVLLDVAQRLQNQGA